MPFEVARTPLQMCADNKKDKIAGNDWTWLASRVRRTDLATGGKELVTLRDTAIYVTSLPTVASSRDEWRAAIEALSGPTIFVPRIMRALNIDKAHAPRKKAANRMMILRQLLLALALTGSALANDL